MPKPLRLHTAIAKTAGWWPNGAKRDEAQTIPADLEEIIKLQLHCWGFVFNIAIVNRHSHSVMREMDFDSFEIASFTVNVLMILCKLKEAIVIVA